LPSQVVKSGNRAFLNTTGLIMNRQQMALIATIAYFLTSTFVFGAEDPEIVKLATQICASCHGQHGDSNSSAFPRLAGQNAAYMETQLKAFKDQARGDPYAVAYMWGMASQLDDGTIKRLTAYYAAELPTPGRIGDAARMAAGKDIYENGVHESGILACISCHGDHAQGKDVIPRLGGQHPEYLLKQLVAFKSLQRANAPVMRMVTDKMTLEQMRSVSEYAASR